jgi:hypothetical protein
VWTSALRPGFRPALLAPTPDHECEELASSRSNPKGKGTLYRAIALHPDPKSRKRHADMGFHEGWGAALDQLVAYMQDR